jgi:hypothetical protein
MSQYFLMKMYNGYKKLSLGNIRFQKCTPET